MLTNFIHLKRQLIIPEDWSIVSTENNEDQISICKFTYNSSISCPTVAVCFTIMNDLTWKLGVHGQNVNAVSHPSLKDCPSVLDYEAANAIIVILNSLHTCVGNPDNNFVSMCDSRNGKFISNDQTIRAYKDDYCPLKLDGEVYSATVWTTNHWI